MGEADRGNSSEPGGEQQACQSKKWGRSLKGTEGSTVARTKPVKVFVISKKFSAVPKASILGREIPNFLHIHMKKSRSLEMQSG